MKITIDTKEDSHHEIRKVIQLLSHLLGEQSPHTTKNEALHANVFENNTPAPNLMSMFDSSPKAELKEELKIEEAKTDGSELSSLEFY
jgi:hypothetical protein